MAAIFEYRYTRHRIGELDSAPTVSSPRAVAQLAMDWIGRAEDERLVVFALNAKNRVIGSELVVAGGTSSAGVRVAQLLRFAVRVNAPRIILAHNHPSGDTTPSPDDLHLTAETLAAGRLLDIELLDHVIVSDVAWVSLRDRGVSFGR